MDTQHDPQSGQTPRVILYTRVSSEDQARDGYSLPEQLRGLRELAANLGWEVLEEIVDDGWSRSTLDRPGITRTRELVATGGVDMVVAWKRDRFGAGYIPGWLEEEFRKKGTELRTPDDLDLSGMAYVMHSGMSDVFARMYIEDLKEKTMRGKAGKVREGKVVGSGPAPYGFRYTHNEKGTRVGLEVLEPEMAVVRRLFELVGERGMPMYSAGRTLEEEGHPAPKGGGWRVSVIRNILNNDVYKPHEYSEVAELDSPQVAERLDPEKSYGISWSGKRRVVGPARGPRTYRRLPRDQWQAVPVPNSEARIPREWVDRARENTSDNPAPAFGGARDWELAGGTLRCGECGGRMSTDQSGGKYYYYNCSAARTRDGRTSKCGGVGSHRAEPLERAVVEAVDGELLQDPARLAEHMDAAIERERAGSSLGYPGGAQEALHARLAKLNQRREGYEEMRADGDMSRERFREKVATLDEERLAAEAELEQMRESAGRVGEMEKAKRAVLEMFGTGLMSGVEWFPPRIRRQVYGLLGLRVTVFADRTLEISGEFDADLMRLALGSPEVEAYVAGLREIDARLGDSEADLDTGDAINRIERELAALRSRFVSSAATYR
ncbi:MAG: hypothetical protein AVDCRST_MAG80-1410 [uncultured Rubrobacteraceae bacterium]|uniref:Recombinase family protein n=1 Tax=uncultured Rubrobacteraceae bacterium TaxID=349277 RepID=A0A6J4QDQ2_9ACTN|nr:MAG: hypothetical protein AVDCRST_MAG80-1410 [uncultured Rubrobacteraceae bacterium]